MQRVFPPPFPSVPFGPLPSVPIASRPGMRPGASCPPALASAVRRQETTCDSAPPESRKPASLEQPDMSVAVEDGELRHWRGFPTRPWRGDVGFLVWAPRPHKEYP